ncbi:thioredoxin reductase [Lachnospiraceae bacterium]|uniref:thioredoxin-disulfide reductase n=1 Tax=Extibacter sp. GGCC_0201 TaxID=2731209 RepID=UPI001AA158E9|nr:thioredoxin-disulfide reductase [Extibacter sp. GGCC_0201]MBO1722638.1 thioredoxin-disulfide reductase [Extibacter sp. GGCC_0201]BDF32946.1 thioredoxin reductase [Lachnospiraceae bacterium]BDF36951.1 thioredoxin reductase [Lachnospiraceae bacterium]
MYDIVIVGGGTAGMTAAIYGLRAGKKVLLIEGTTFGGQITLSPHVENYPGIAEVSGSQFATAMAEQASALGAELEYTKVKSVRKDGGNKIVVTEDKEIPCRTVILATGVSHRHLGVPREEELVGAGVSYCAVCDGAFFKGSDVAVVGGGSTALQDAVFLSEYCSHVYVVHRRDEFRGEKHLVETLSARDNVTFVLDSVVSEIKGEDAVESIRILNKKTGGTSELKVEGIFIAVGQKPNNDPFEEIVKLNDEGYILAAEDCMTSCPGIFAAGDCRTKEVRQLTTAAADGSVAALAACRYIEEMNV